MPRAKKIIASELKPDADDNNLLARKTSSRALRAHIKRIKNAKLAAEEIFGEMKIDAARGAIEILWETLFDYLCSGKEIDTAEMGALSSVVQRLASSRVQMANFSAKCSDKSNASSSGELSPEAVEKIEEALKLL